jgi:prevent-host-death family protein
MNITNTSVTEKSVPSFEARRHFGKLIDGVKAGDKFVIKEHGQPVAAIVPQHDFSRLVWRVAIASAGFFQSSHWPWFALPSWWSTSCST